ncbi:MAG: 4Fe-4S binding protein [Candidatus Methanoperedens sp.]|nr:4Fe-4S binding protein [Candidatus Methanoperedens sp.]
MDQKILILSVIFLLFAFAFPVNANEMDNMDMSDPNAMNMDQPAAGHGADEPAAGHGMNGEVNWYAIALFIAIIGVVGYYASKTEKLRKINFLNYAPLKSLLKSRWYPLIFVLPTMIIFAIIVIKLFFGSAEASTNFGSIMMWIFLWPILPVLFLLFGRLWCSVCPLSRVCDGVQKKVGMHRKVPKFLQTYGVWIIIFAFLVITWSDVIFGVVESPLNTGILLLFVLTGVVFMGAVFEKRAWCRYLCFLGGLSSNYSMSSALELRADSEVCKTCKTPLCYKGNAKTGGCSMFEYPRTMDSNRACNFCSNCIKTCDHDAIRITPRPPTSELWFIKKPRFEESFLATALIGIVVSQTMIMLEVWEPFMTLFENATGITNFIVAWTLIFAGAMLLPVLLMLAASFISSIIPGRTSNSDLISDQTAEMSAVSKDSTETTLSGFIRYGYALIPLGLGIHLAHNAKHFLGEGFAVFYSSASLVGWNITGDLSILNMPTIQIIQYILSILGVLGAIYTAYKISTNNPNIRSSVVPYIVLILMFGIVALWMYSIPMAARAH